jgi:hypothetical protein
MNCKNKRFGLTYQRRAMRFNGLSQKKGFQTTVVEVLIVL